MQIIKEIDFVGEYYLPKDCFTEYGYYIEKYEKELLLNLFGATQYALFVADLTVVDPIQPQDAVYLSAFDPFDIDDNNCVRSSEGIKKMLIQYIYFHLQRDWINHSTNAGVMRMNSDNSSNLGYKGYNLVESYNDSIKNYKSIQWFLCENEADYEDLNTQYKDFISGI